MELMKKILRRIKILIKNIPAIIKAFWSEPEKHPWDFVFYFLIMPSSKKHSKIADYTKRYYKTRIITEGQTLIDFGMAKIVVPDSLLSNTQKLWDLLFIYFEILYPNLVSIPIPILATNDPYEMSPGVFLENNDVVIDGGANVGMFSFLAAQKIGRNGKIFAFEPLPQVNSIFRNSLPYNYAGGANIELVPWALGAKSDESILNFSKNDLLGASMCRGHHESTIKVRQVALDDFVLEQGLDRVNFIKLDIEGMEREFLNGANNTIAKFKPKLSICAYHQSDDLLVIPDIIKNICPEYQIIQSETKIYAWCLKN